MIRVVFDTNVLISGLLWSGIPSKLLKLVDDGRLYLCLNESMLKELADVVDRPKFRSQLNKLKLESSELVTIVAEKSLLFEDIQFPSVIHQDPDDDNVLACAFSSQSQYIISGDDHLLKLKSYQNIRILSPSEALKLFRR